MENNRSIGERILELRKNKSMTQDELAGRMGITPQALSKWERGLSLPDVGLLANLCGVLDVSADYLLGVEPKNLTEDGDRNKTSKIWNNLKNCLEPVVILFGTDIVPAFLDNHFVGEIGAVRERLSTEGILLPIVRLRDDERLKPNEFMVLAYMNVLHEETIPDTKSLSSSYIIGVLEEVVRQHYDEIISADIVKDLVDNLQQSRPALIGGVVPEVISYGLLSDVLKALYKRGDYPLYLQKVIESMERDLRHDPGCPEDILIKNAAREIERADNYSVMRGRYRM